MRKFPLIICNYRECFQVKSLCKWEAINSFFPSNLLFSLYLIPAQGVHTVSLFLTSIYFFFIPPQLIFEITSYETPKKFNLQGKAVSVLLEPCLPHCYSHKNFIKDLLPVKPSLILKAPKRNIKDDELKRPKRLCRGVLRPPTLSRQV